MSDINALTEVCSGWEETSADGMVCSSAKLGGIIDSTIMTGEWFVIFNDHRSTMEGFKTRQEAIEAFIAAPLVREYYKVWFFDGHQRWRRFDNPKQVQDFEAAYGFDHGGIVFCKEDAAGNSLLPSDS